MKVKDLIELLQGQDPNTDIDICVDGRVNIPSCIKTVTVIPSPKHIWSDWFTERRLVIQ